MSCDVGEVTKRLETAAELILQPFRHFTYVTTHSPTLPSLYLRHCSFPNHSVASPTSQFILQPFFRFSYVTSSSLNSPGEPPTIQTKKSVEIHCTSTTTTTTTNNNNNCMLFIVKGKLCQRALEGLKKMKCYI